MDSEWLYVCTNGGTTVYPYGDDYVAGKCVDENFDGGSRVGSPGSTECRGIAPPFDEVFDLAGGLAEWTDGCAADRNRCTVHGGALVDVDSPCRAGGHAFLRSTLIAFGFRCCADPIQ
jgi:formylglycine-generating enzyme required for sulfatase activity